MDDYLVFNLSGIFLTVLLSAFFSSLETAITSLSEPKIEALITQNRFLASMLKKWVKEPGILLSAILIGNNLVNILGAVLAGNFFHHLLADKIGTLGADSVAVGAMTIFVLIFGEITPKSYAKINAEKFVVPAMLVMKFFYMIFYPLAFVLSKFAKLLIKTLGGNDVVKEAITETDIEYFIKKGSNLGVFEEQEQAEMLSSVIEFKDTLVREIMIPRTDAHFLESTTKIDEAIEKFGEWGHSRIPVYGETIDDVLGIFYTKDLALLLKNNKIKLSDTIDKLIRKSILFVPETQKINETLKTMQTKRNHMAIVVDEFGGTSGLITLEDILEELVGDIMDEDDKDENTIIKKKNDIIDVQAHISISDLEEELGIEIPEDAEYNSLAGFIIANAGKVPQKGYEIKFKNYIFKVSESDERHIERVEIKIMPETSPEIITE